MMMTNDEKGGRRAGRAPGMILAALTLMMIGMTVSLRAQLYRDPGYKMPLPTPKVVNEVGIDQKLDAQVPLDIPFRDETGKTVKFGDYFGSKPVMLVFAYYECPMLCTEVLNGAVKALRPISFDVGKEFDVVIVSINPKETPKLAAEKKATYVKQYKRPGTEGGWHFLTGDQPSIEALTKAAGFRYVYDPNTEQFAHAGGIMVLTPKGRLARYFYGVEYASNDLRLGLVEASNNKIGSAVDQILLLCYHYDPVTGKYGGLIIDTMQVAGIITLLALGSFVFIMLRRDRRKKMVGLDGGVAQSVGMRNGSIH